MKTATSRPRARRTHQHNSTSRQCEQAVLEALLGVVQETRALVAAERVPELALGQGPLFAKPRLSLSTRTQQEAGEGNCPDLSVVAVHFAPALTQHGLRLGADHTFDQVLGAVIELLSKAQKNN
jgi:hypothetical protein